MIPETILKKMVIVLLRIWMNKKRMCVAHSFFTLFMLDSYITEITFIANLHIPMLIQQCNLDIVEAA